MVLKRMVKVTLSPSEEKAIKITAEIIKEICHEFNNCEGCPFAELCNEGSSYPHIFLEDFIKECEIET